MLPTRCPHCQAELPGGGRFCGVCGRRIEGWRGVIAAPPDLLDPVAVADRGADRGADRAAAPAEPPSDEGSAAEGRASAARAAGGNGGLPGSARSLRRQPAPSQVTPREIPSSEDRTRPVRPSKNLAAARAAADIESRRPTGEMPGLGHELRAKAPDHRVHTSPLGNVLPLAFMDALSGVVPDPQGPPAAPSSTSAGSASSATSGASPVSLGPARDARLDDAPDRPSGRSAQLGLSERSASQRSAASQRSYDRRGRSLRSDEQTPVRGSPASVADSAGESTGPGTARSQRSQPGSERTPHRVAAHVQLPALASESRHRDPDTPEPVRFDPTQMVARPRRLQRRLIRVTRRLAWGLLWLSIGGAVAYAVAHFLRRSPPPVETSPAPALRPPPAAGPQRPIRPRPAAPPSTPRARDLLVSVPAAPTAPAAAPAPPPVGAAATAPATPASPASPVEVPAEPGQPALPDLSKLPPQQRAAVDQTIANIEFVASTYRAQVRACYERVARAQGSLPGGRVEVALTLSDAGLVQSVVTVENTLDLPVLSACLEQRVSEWRFPRPTGPLRTFRFPFLFAPTSPSGAAGGAAVPPPAP
ncbi:MAG: AgmX/PglI C-terminal domain-containing protein [Polyangia bacterium]